MSPPSPTDSACLAGRPGAARPGGPAQLAWSHPPSRRFRTFLGLTRNFPKLPRTFPYMNQGVFHHSESIRDTPEIIWDSELSLNYNCTYLSLLPKASY